MKRRYQWILRAWGEWQVVEVVLEGDEPKYFHECGYEHQFSVSEVGTEELASYVKWGEVLQPPAI